MPQLFRGMKENDQGRPVIGQDARTLGIRPGIDVPTTDPGDIVRPGQGGLSVSPGDPMNLPRHRRPPEFQGVGRDPIWSIPADELGRDLAYRPDPDQEGHGFIEPSRSMTLDEFQDALARTQERWQKVVPSPNAGSTSDDR